MRIVLTDSERDTLIREVMENFPEASSPSVICTKYNYAKTEFEFLDVESDRTYKLDLNELRKGLKQLLDVMADGGLKGIARSVFPDVLDAGNWDADAADALVQTAIFGDVIYG